MDFQLNVFLQFSYLLLQSLITLLRWQVGKVLLCFNNLKRDEIETNNDEKTQHDYLQNTKQLTTLHANETV
jgi:hypothetical protein